jgi:hypothetical protein
MTIRLQRFGLGQVRMGIAYRNLITANMAKASVIWNGVWVLGVKAR